MKATIRTGFLGYTFSFVDDHVKPTFNAANENSDTTNDDVYIKVRAAGINPADYKFPRLLGGETVGIDFCGTIEDIGSTFTNNNENTHYKVGDDVFGTCSTGSLAEYCVANSNSIAKVPSGWSFEECAALPVAYMSSLQSLRIGKITYDLDDSETSEKDNKQKSVLVIGASGGCGIAGIQLCKAMGVGRIVAICSKKNAEFVKDFGATEIIPYDDESNLTNFFTSNEGKFDCVFDAASGSGGGEDYCTMSLTLLTKDVASGRYTGEYVALSGPPSKWARALLGKQKPNESIMMMKSNSSDLQLVTTLLDKTGTKPIINTMPFSKEGMEDGFKLLKSRRTKGKIVFKL